jgi:hypothetical protein
MTTTLTRGSPMVGRIPGIRLFARHAGNPWSSDPGDLEAMT